MIYYRVILITDESMQASLNILPLLISLLKSSKKSYILIKARKHFLCVNCNHLVQN